MILMFTNIFLMLMLILVFFYFQTTFMLKIFNKSNFECGFNTKNLNNSIFCVNYFYMTIIFLIFDMEIIMIFPIIIFKMTISQLMIIFFMMMLFCYLLKMEWNNMLLEWSN